MKDWTEEEIGALRRMLEKAQKDPDFSEEDIQVLKKFTETIKGLNAFGRFAKWVIFILAAVAGAMTAWEQITDRIKIWFLG